MHIIDKKEAPAVNRKRVARLQLLHTDNGPAIITLDVFDDAHVVVSYETMRADQMGSAMQIGTMISGSAKTASLVVQSREKFAKDDIKELLLRFLAKMFKEIAESAGRDWSLTED